MNQRAKEISGLALLVVLSATFIFSAVTKFVSIEPFEWTFMDMGLPNSLAFFLARFMIGFEFMLALFMLAHFYLKKFTYPITNLFLVVMTIYLVIILVTKGNDVDCGCFGDTLPMSPAVSIVKNLVLIGITLLLSRIYPVKPYRFQLPLSIAGAAATIAIPFLFVPYSQEPKPINLDALYADRTHLPSVELRRGKHLIAFMSLGCPHCRSAAGIFGEMYKKDSSLPLFMILYGAEADTADFFKETKANKVPHFSFNDMTAFRKMAGKYVPQIYWINNGILERKLSYIHLNPKMIGNWRQ